MNREDLVSLCEKFANRRGLAVGRITIETVAASVDPVPEIIRSFRRAEISESEKNALLSLVCDDEDICDETVCVCDPYADEMAMESDDD